jgi:hypothetical protein
MYEIGIPYYEKVEQEGLVTSTMSLFSRPVPTGFILQVDWSMLVFNLAVTVMKLRYAARKNGTDHLINYLTAVALESPITVNAPGVNVPFLVDQDFALGVTGPVTVTTTTNAVLYITGRLYRREASMVQDK